MTFHKAVASNDFDMINENHYVYVKCQQDKFVILSLYVDDILLAENDKEFVNSIKRWLSSNFEMRDMREAAYILGVKIYRDRSRKLLALSQESYIKRVLK